MLAPNVADQHPTGCSARHARSSMAKRRVTARPAGLIWLAWCRVIEGTTTMNKGDLVDRLRELGAIDRTLLIVPHSLLTQAADEIARLREALGKDRDRLDFLDECNRRLNARYGTNYGWKLVLNHNVNRLFLGDHLDVDLNDSHGGKGKLPSCRAAIDKEMDRITALQHKEPQG